ncbi:MAG: hypothetical protein KAX49_03795 [Halanaerobiales bacterium]|nr:hypothetical protein [Halanaerobiales bacterium]
MSKKKRHLREKKEWDKKHIKHNPKEYESYNLDEIKKRKEIIRKRHTSNKYRIIDDDEFLD